MSLKFQGFAFSALAWLTLVASFWLPTWSTQAQLVILSPIILLLGVPHGALDTVFVRQLVVIQSAAGWMLFLIAYLLAAVSVAAVWWFAPGFFLVVFLLISAFHFSGDPDSQTPVWFRALYGGAVIVCPIALHADAVLEIFALLSGLPAAQAVVVALQSLAWPWVAAIAIAAIAGARRDLPRSIELVSMTALLCFAPPLMGFTVYFCFMHSARHVLRTRTYSTVGTLRHLLGLAVWPMLFTLAGVALAAWLFEDKPLDMRLVQLLFVGLAALTVPHMMVVEKVRLSGWVLGSRKSGSGSSS